MLDTILAVLIACASMGVLIAMSVRADSRFSHRERLPMQWSFGGSVNWTAPRRVALALTPTLALLCLLAAVVSTALLEPRPGQEGLEGLVVLLLGMGFVAVHAFHLWLIGKADGGA